MGEEKEGRGFKVEQPGLHKIVNDDYSLIFQKGNGFGLNRDLKHTAAISVLNPDEGLI